MWTGLNLKHVALVARFWSRFALRTGGGLVFLLLLVISGLSVAAAFITPVEEIAKTRELREASREQGRELDTGTLIDEAAKTEEVRDVVSWIAEADSTQTDYLLETNPALLSAILLVLLMIIPYLACFGGFNQTSGDIQNRGLRYLLLRTERPNIFFGRFAGAAFFTLIYLGAVVTLVLLYVGLKLRIYAAGPLIGWGLQGYVALLFLTLPYLALCSWISAAIDSPFASLVLCFLVTGLPLAFLWALASVVNADFDAIARILPWGWKYDLLHGEAMKRLVAMLMMLLFTSVFLLIGLRSFHRRDL
jgi:hypothetical protein